MECLGRALARAQHYLDAKGREPPHTEVDYDPMTLGKFHAVWYLQNQLRSNPVFRSPSRSSSTGCS